MILIVENWKGVSVIEHNHQANLTVAQRSKNPKFKTPVCVPITVAIYRLKRPVIPCIFLLTAVKTRENPKSDSFRSLRGGFSQMGSQCSE